MGFNNNNYIFGYINETIINQYNFQNLIAGVGYLIKNGQNYLNESLKIETTTI